jgi:hypothetical protein
MPDLTEGTAEILVFVIGALTMIFITPFFAEFLRGIAASLRDLLSGLF